MPNPPGPTLMGKTRSRRLSSAVVGSLLFHVLALAIIGLNVATLTPTPLAPVRETQVWLYALPPLEKVKPHQPSSPPRLLDQRRPLPARTPPPKAAAPRAVAGPATPPSPLTGAAVAPGPASDRLASSSSASDGVAEALRTSVGCDADHVVHLTTGERDKCSQKFGETARRGQPFVKPVDRSFAAQAAEDERRRQNRQGPLQDNVKPCSGEGSNLGGGCLSDSAIAHVPLPQP